ncbi:MAG: hypothetical protein ACOVN0_06120 [Niveispirillum sp.]|uniref:hypothetical protein n=1 Tax=Niveispirillum sp. TaxID=1917217 RepID=UPI003BA7E833
MAEEDPEAAAYAAQAETVTALVAPEWRWIWRAWHRLDHERQWIAGGMGPSQPAGIPWSVVRAWAADHAMDAEAAELLDHGIQAMDGVYRAWWVERAGQRA